MSEEMKMWLEVIITGILDLTELPALLWFYNNDHPYGAAMMLSLALRRFIRDIRKAFTA